MKTLALFILIHIQILDFKTNETLPAVSIQTNKSIYYTDFDGKVNIPNDEKIVNISCISYENITNITLFNDTIITLQEH